MSTNTEVTRIDFGQEAFDVCDNCGAHAASGRTINHHATCKPGESKRWERYYNQPEDTTMSTDSLQKFLDRVEKAKDRGRSPFWSPTEKTPAIVGEIEEYVSTKTQYGELQGAVVRLLDKAVVQDDKDSPQRLAEPDEAAVIWIRNTSLIEKWARLEPREGETVAVKYLGGGNRKSDGKPYKIFTVLVDREGAPAPAPAKEQPEYSSFDDEEWDADTADTGEQLPF